MLIHLAPKRLQIKRSPLLASILSYPFGGSLGPAFVVADHQVGSARLSHVAADRLISGRGRFFPRHTRSRQSLNAKIKRIPHNPLLYHTPYSRILCVSDCRLHRASNGHSPRILFALAFLNGVRGAFAYHKLPARPVGLASMQ